MPVLSFPASPSLNQTYTSGGKIWKWNGTVWAVVRTTAQGGESAYQIAVRNGFVGSEADWLAQLGGGAEALYTWVAYADDITGATNFSLIFDGQDYMGLGVNKSSPAPSSNPADYSWIALGADSAIQAFLTNESHTVAASAAGAVASFDGAGGVFTVFEGTNDVTENATFSVAAETGVDVSINSAGVYIVNSMSADTGTATLRAVYSGVTIDRVYSITKAKAGVGGGAEVLAIAASAQAFTFLDGLVNPANQTITLTAGGVEGSITWSSSPIIPFSVSGDNGEVASITISNFGSSRTQVVFTATHDETGMTDRITLFKLNQSSAEGGATQNQQFSTPYNPGVVSKPTPGSGTSGGFDSDAYSAATIVGDFILRFVPLENSAGGIIVALDDNPAGSSPGTTNTDYSFVLGTSTLDAYVTGTSGFTGTYAEGDVLEIRRTGSTWSWLKNNSQVHTASGSTNNMGIRVALQAVGSVVSDLQLIQGGVSKSLALTSRGSVAATSLPAENARNEYQGSVKVLINGVWATYATRNVHTGPWLAGTTYAAGDIFTFAGDTYMVRIPHLATGTEPDNTKVELLSTSGPGGLSGFLSNESHLVIADSAGTVAGGQFAAAGGTFRVFYGGDEVTDDCTFSVFSETGVDVSINSSTGVYTVASMSADTGTAIFSAQLEDGAIIQKTYSIAKSKVGADGSNAKLIYVTSDRQTITYDSANALNPSSQTTTFTAVVQNSSATVNWTMKTISGTVLDPNLYLSATTGSSVQMTASNFNTARGVTEGVIVTATISDGGTFSDSISVVRVKQGAAGTPGADGFTGVLSNESHTVATAPDGSGGNYAIAGGTFRVFKGLVDFTTGQGVIYSLQSATGVLISINNSTGVYTVTGMTADQGVAILRANYAGTIVDKTYTISKARAGVDGQTAKMVTVSSNRQTIAYDNSDDILPSQDIVVTATKQNTSATVTWSLTELDGTVLTAATYLSATTGDTVTMTGVNFDAAITAAATQGVIITATATDGTTFTDSISIIKVRDGVDGTASLTGYLTNEAHVLAAESDGTVTDFTQAGGSFKLFHGTDDVTSAPGNSFGVVSETGVDVSINTTTGVYTVTSMAADIGSATFSATWSGVTIQKTYTIVKSRAGVDGSSPKLLSVHTNTQTIAYDAAGAPNPSGQTITFSALKQNTTATVTWTVKDLNGNSRTPTTTYLSAATGDSVTMTESQFAAARNAFGGVVVTATLTDGITISDSASVVYVASGATGATGEAGIVGLLTNESHTVAADTAGVVSSYTGAGGVFKVFEGTVDMSGDETVTYSVPSETNVDVTIGADGVYTVSSLTAGTGTAILRAVYKGVNIDKVYSITKAIAGADGSNAKILIISSDRQTITYGGDGFLNPSSQTITFTAQKQNTTGTVNWTLKRADGTVLTPATYLSGTTGDTITMTAANFDAARSTSSGVMVTGTITDGVTITDTVSVVKVQSGADGTGSKSGYLTNESHIIPTAGDGSSPDFTGAGGTFKVFNGLTDVTTEATFDIPGGGAVACTATIDASTGVYSITGISANVATVTFRAQHGPTTLTKVMSLVKSRAGADGASSKLISVNSTHQTFSYTGVGGIRTQTTTITAQRQNTTQPTSWDVYSLDGNKRLGSGAAPVTGYFTDGGDTLTLTHTNFNNFLTAFSTTGMTIEGKFTDGSTYADRISIIKISDGSQGVAGNDAKLFAVYSNRQTITYTGAGAINPATQDIVFTASKQNTSAVVSWSVTDADGTARTPVTTYLSSATGDSVTMTAAQFESARASTPGVIVTGTITDGLTFTDKVSVAQVKSGTNAIVGFLTNEAATVPSDGTGAVSGADLATITGSFKIYQGTTDVSTGNSITYSVQSQTGMTASINSSSGAYTVSALTASVGVATLAATLPGALGGGVIFKDLTVAKATAGSPALHGYLSNDTVSLTANTAGTVSDFSPANGNFVVQFGSTTLASPAVSFSKVSQTGCTATINATTGAYSVSAMSADQAIIVFRALTSAAYGSVQIDKILTLSKSRAGESGAGIRLSPTATGFVVVDGVLTPSSQSITITGVLTNLAGPITWSTAPNVTSGTGTNFTITSSQFNPSVNSQVVVTANVPSGESQTLVLHRLERFSDAYMTAIDNAKAQAAAAKAFADDVADNNKFSKDEKKRYKNKVNEWTTTVPSLVAQGNTMGLTTQASALSTAWTDFYNYLVANHYNDTSDSDSISRTTFQAKEGAFSNALTNLANALHTKAASTADWSTVGGRPSELLDGRLGLGLNADGTLATNIPTSVLTGSNVLRRTGGGLFSGHLNSTRGATLGVDTFDTDGVTALNATHLKNASITIDGSGNIVGIGTAGIQVNNANQLWSQVGGAGRPADNATVNNVTYSSTTPSSPSNGDIWVNTALTPARTMVRVAGAWQAAANYVTGTSHLSDDAGLGSTAVWSNVTGAGRPADGATVNNVTYSASAPVTPANGDIWVDTSTTPYKTKVRVASAWQIAGNYTTGTSHLTDDAGLGTTANWTNVASRPTHLTDGRIAAALNADGDLVRAIPESTLTGSNVLRRAGGGLFAGSLAATRNETTYSTTAPASPDNGDIWVDTSVTPFRTKIRIAGAWQIAGNYTTGTSHLADDAGLGSTAIWSSVSGAGRPADGATRNQVFYSGTTPASPADGDIWVETDVTPNVTWLRVGGAWQIAGNYVTNTTHLTDGAGLGSTAVWSNVTGSGRPADNATRNALTRSASAPGSPADGDIWVDTSVTPNVTRVRVAGSWQVAGNYTTGTSHLTDDAGLGSTANWANVTGAGKPQDGATVGADWSTNVAGRPGHLTDGRIATALDASGNLVSAIPTSTLNSSHVLRYTGGGAYSGALNATYGADLATNVTNNNLDNVTNGATYGRIRNTQLSSGNHKLTVAGSGTRVADQRNLPAMSAMNLSYKWSGTISYTSTTTTGTINVGASTVLIGSVSVAYNAMSVGVSGTSGTTSTYYLYLDDANYSGGTKTLVATQTGNNIYLSDDRVYVGTISVYFPTSGGGTGGGDYGGGCVESSSWVETQDGFKLASEIAKGDMLRVLGDDYESTRWEECTDNRTSQQALFRIRSQSGVELVCSDSTPITLRDGTAIAVWKIKNTELPVYVDDKLTWEPCWAEPIGMGSVQMIYCNNQVYAAGSELGAQILTHNPTNPKP